MFGLITHVHTEKLHVRFAGGRKRGPRAGLTTVVPHPPHAFFLSCILLSCSLSVRATVVCFLYLSQHRKSSTLCFYKLYSQRDNTSRIKTIPQTIKNFCWLQVSLQDSSSQDWSFQIRPLETGFSFRTSKVRLSSQFMLCWVESVRIQIKVHIFQRQEGSSYVNTQVLTSICIKLCKHIHLLRSAHRSSSVSRALLKHRSNLFGSRFVIQVLCSEPGERELDVRARSTEICK